MDNLNNEILNNTNEHINRFNKLISDAIEDSVLTLLNMKNNESYMNNVRDCVKLLVRTYNKGNKLLIAGNGGSAADAQHIAGELIGQFYELNRPSYPAIALSTDTSVLTSISNDRSYSEVFSRQVEGLGMYEDTLLVISTSGNSANLIKAIQVAKKRKMNVVGLLGKNGGKIKEYCDISIVINNESTPRIQEIHQLTYHLICQLVEMSITTNE